MVLPTYQEAENIVAVLQRLRSSVPQADILVVDDASPDGTAALAEAEGRHLGGVEVMTRPGKLGLGGAYRFGFHRGLAQGYQVLVEMDADLSHDPESLPALLAAVAGGADVAIGSRYVAGAKIPDWPWHRRLLSRWGNRYAGRILRIGVADATSGFRAYRAECLADIDLETVRADGYGFQVEMVRRMTKHGAKVVEVPINFVDRCRGVSKMSSSIVAEAFALVTWWGLRDRLQTGRTCGGRALQPTLAPNTPAPGPARNELVTRDNP